MKVIQALIKDRKIEGVSEQGILDQRGTKTSPGLREAPRLRCTIARDITRRGR
jgi:hypothetical protein